jgi:hypothetical protein
MLWTVGILLMVLWGAALARAYTLGGFVHVLLALSVGAFVVGFIQRHRTFRR